MPVMEIILFSVMWRASPTFPVTLFGCFCRVIEAATA